MSSILTESSPRGPTDKASDYESGDCGFESHRGCFLRFLRFSALNLMKIFIKSNTLRGDRTHDHKIKSLALYHLSYEGNSYGGKMVENPGFDPGASRLQSAHSTD